MQKTIRSVDATVRIVDGNVVLLKNPCTQAIWRKEIPITRGYEYDLRDCRRVGLITRCETAAQLRAAEIRFLKVEIGTDERWPVAHRLRLASLSIWAGARAKNVVRCGVRQVQPGVWAGSL